ncbi:MAG: hypothetical protein J6C59_00345 [Muribaculaceae bacterium]|nr:hypothetical protein [Muribaculaceae bacterium]
MFDVYFFGKFSVYGKYQEVPDSQTTVFKQMLKELKKSKYSEAVMFKRLDNQRIYYSYIRQIGYGKYFGVGIVRDKSFDRFVDLCTYFRNEIIKRLLEEKIVIKYDVSKWIVFAHEDLKKYSTEIGLFLSNLQPWRWHSSMLKPLAGNVGVNALIIREFPGRFRYGEFKSLSFEDPDLLKTYTQLLELGYPNFFVGIKD